MEALAAALGERGATTALAPLHDAPVEGDVVVVDSYLVRADDSDRVSAHRVAAIDDLDRDLAVDLLVDPSGHGGAGRARLVLTGLEHALLPPGRAGSAYRPAGDTVDTVLVTAGGADAEGMGARVAAAVRETVPDRTAVRLVMGPWGSRDVPCGVEAVEPPDGLADELAGADLVVTAAGVTLLEAVAMGRPTLGFCTAENQARYLGRVADAGAVVVTTVESAGADAGALAADGARRARLAGRGPRVVDGHGAARVADALLSLP
jgi:spore coat polysaccharide biosynthesis predicted glycosyltransferase SpsG